MSALRLVEAAPEPEPVPKCGHLGCLEPGVNMTTLVSRRGKFWDLFHCDEHREDGVRVAIGLGFIEPAAPGMPAFPQAV